MQCPPQNEKECHRLLIGFVLLTGLLAAGPGVYSTSAQRRASTGADTTVRGDTSTTNTFQEQKSPIRAVLYSAAGTAALVPFAGVGLVLGPSVGHFYAGNTQQALTGIAIRTGSAAAGGTGVLLSFETDYVGPLLLATGVLVMGGSILYDTVTAWDSAQEYNELHRVRTAMVPTVNPAATQAGLTVRVTF